MVTKDNPMKTLPFDTYLGDVVDVAKGDTLLVLASSELVGELAGNTVDVINDEEIVVEVVDVKKDHLVVTDNGGVKFDLYDGDCILIEKL